MLIAQQVHRAKPVASRVLRPSPAVERVAMAVHEVERVAIVRRVAPRQVMVVTGSVVIGRQGDAGTPTCQMVVMGSVTTSKVHQPLGMQSIVVAGGGVALNRVVSMGGSSLAFGAVHVLTDHEGEVVTDHLGLPITTVPQVWMVIGGGGTWTQRTGYGGSLGANRIRQPSPRQVMVLTGSVGVQSMTLIDDPWISRTVATGAIATTRVANVAPEQTMVVAGSLIVGIWGKWTQRTGYGGAVAMTRVLNAAPEQTMVATGSIVIDSI